MKPSWEKYEQDRGRSFVKQWLYARAKSLVALLLLLCLVLSWTKSVSYPPALNHYLDSFVHITPPTAPPPPKLHFLLPATHTELNLCKTLLTSSILSYPTPHLVNWNKTYDREGLLSGGAHLAKIDGVLSYLSALSSKQSSDLVLVLDAFDTWLQLPPSVLLSRYHSIVRAADTRLALQHGHDGVIPPAGKTHRVVFAADKRCSPNDPLGPTCLLQTESPLRTDLYGPNTDTDEGYEWASSYRPRYLNSGLIMGPAGDLQRIFLRAREKLVFQKFGSDQSVFHIVYAAQQVMRERERRRHLTPAEHAYERKLEHTAINEGKDASHSSRAMFDLVHDLNSHEYMEWMERIGAEQDWEFGITLDYASELIQQTTSAAIETAFLTYNRTQRGSVHDRKARLAGCQARVADRLSGDVLTSREDIADGKNWPQRALFTNVCTGNVPVVIHHNGDKEQRERQWDEAWMSHAATRMRQIGAQDKHVDGVIEAMADSGERMTWDELCVGKPWTEALYKVSSVD